MKLHQRILILSAGIGGGHLAAARALAAVLSQRPGVKVRHEDALRLTSAPLRALYADLYAQVLKRYPQLVGWWYDREHTPFRGDRLRTLWERLNAEPLVATIGRYRPDITICTHFMPADIVAQLLLRGTLQSTLSIVITDYDFQGMWLNRAFQRYFVPLDETRAYVESLGVPAERVTVSGIPIDPRFGTDLDRSAVLSRYGLQADLPVLLVAAGALGQESVHLVMEQLSSLQHPAQAIVVCGTNEPLRHEIEHSFALDCARFRVLGYTTDMPALMQAATLYVGKPGGLSSAECMAANLPMVLVAPIPGQEERNADHLLEAGVAIRCRDLPILAFKIDRLLSSPARLATMRANTAQLARPDAAQVIAETVLDEHLPPLILDEPETIA